MSINLDQAFGLHAKSMMIRSERAEVLASNIANADTPGYKAKDLDFQKMLTNASAKQQMSMSRTNNKHFEMASEFNPNLEYRIPNQPDTGDGNTVDAQVERNLYLQNTLAYQASVQFLNGKILSIKKAITGGQS